VHSQVVARLSETCEVIANPSRETRPREEVLRRAQDASALMVFMPDLVDAAFLDACPDLRGHIRLVCVQCYEFIRYSADIPRTDLCCLHCANSPLRFSIPPAGG
jgi:hypothetical protein